MRDRKKQITRRTFIKKTTQAALGSFMVPGLVGCVSSQIEPVTPMSEVQQVPIIDIHSHLIPIYLRADLGTSPDKMIETMNESGIDRMIILGFGHEVKDLPGQFPGKLYASYILYNFRWRQDSRFDRLIPREQRITNGTRSGEVDNIGGEFEQALETGNYHAVGEVTTIARPIMGGVAGNRTPLPGSTIAPNSPLILRLIEIAGNFDVPINIHCEQTAIKEMIFAISAYPKTRIVWAHTGSYLSTKTIKKLLEDHANLNFDLSSRNRLYQPRASSLTSSGLLREDWRLLFEMYPDRFYFGVDFLTSSQLKYASNIIENWRIILSQLTPETGNKISFKNAINTYRL